MHHPPAYDVDMNASTNPYQPPANDTDLEIAGNVRPQLYAGGLTAILFLGAGVGLIVGLLFAMDQNFHTILVSPLIAWLGTFYTLLSMIRGHDLPPGLKVIFSIALTIPAYSMFFLLFAFQGLFYFSYSEKSVDDTLGPVVLATVAYATVLMLMAWLVRSRLQPQ